MSIVDELTGLYNRTGFLILADHHLKLADRMKEPLTLLFVELDRPSTDDAARRLIVEIGNVIKETLRASDVFGRVADHQFCVLLAGTSAAAADTVLVRLVEAVAQFNAREGRTDDLAISVGTARYDPANPMAIEDLMGRADELMLEDKRRRERS